MREGLRSQKKPENDERVDQREGDGENREVSDLRGEGQKEGEGITKEPVFQRREEKGERSKAGMSKGEGSKAGMSNGARILRSMRDEGDDGKEPDVFAEKHRGQEGIDMTEANQKNGEGDDDSVSYDASDEDWVMENEKRKGMKKSKGKRGRPCKVESKEQEEDLMEEDNGGDGDGKGKEKEKKRPGRPRKTKLKEQDQPVDQLQCDGGNSPKDTNDDEVDIDEIEDVESGRSFENNVTASPVRLNTSSVFDIDTYYKSEAKRSVKQGMMEQLKDAGWNTDYWTRDGRESKGAGYVSLDGKVFWSILYAYNRLKVHYEAGDGEGKVYVPGFKFRPLPDFYVNTLTNDMNTNREIEEELVHGGGTSGNAVDRVNETVKQGSGAAGLGKPDVILLNEKPVGKRGHRQKKTHSKRRCAPYNGKRNVLSLKLGLILIFPLV